MTDRPPNQVHGRTDVLPALRLEPHSAFLAAYRLSRISCPDALERSTTLDPVDPFTPQLGLPGPPDIPSHLLPELPAGERRARRLALLLDSDDPDIRDWAQAEYLKLGRTGRQLVREGVFEVKVMLDGADENPAEEWSANEREEDLEKLKERLGGEKERREEREEVEREMVWAREMFGKWLIDGRVDGVFRLAAGVLNELLKEVARDEGEEWVAGEEVEDAAEEPVPKDSDVVPKSSSPSSTLTASKTVGAEQVAPVRTPSSASVASSKRGTKRPSEPAPKVERELEPEPEPKPQIDPSPAPDSEAKLEEPADHNSPEQSHTERSRESSPLPIPVPLPVLHPSIFSEEGLLTYAINAIHPDPPPDSSSPVEQVRPDSQLSSSHHTVKPPDDPAVQHNTYADFYAKDPRRRKTPLLHVKPLPNNQPLPKAEREYDSYADFYANDPRRMRHVDDRPLPALVKKEVKKEAAKKEAGASADRSSHPQSSSKPSKLVIPSKAVADPPRVTGSKHRHRSDSRPHPRREASPTLENVAVSSNLSGSSGRLTTPAASLAPSRSRSPSRDKRHSSHRKSGHKSRRHSPGLTSPTPSQASGRHRDSRSRHNTPPLPIPPPAPAPKPTPPPTHKRSWRPFRIQGGAASASSDGNRSRAASPEPTPIMPRGQPYGSGPIGPLVPTPTMTSDVGAGEREHEGGGSGDHDGVAAPAEAVVPPAPPLPPVQFWLPGYPAYKLDHAYTARAGPSADEGRRRERRHRDHQASSSASSASSASRLLPPPAPPVFLALGARRACIPYTPAFQGIDTRVVRPLSAREKLAMRDAVSVLVRLGARVVGAEAGGLGVRGEMWSLSYVGF